MDKKYTVIACIPAYNEECTIAKVVILTQRYVDKVIVCDDGSTDMTGEIARRLGAEVIRHKKTWAMALPFAPCSRGHEKLIQM